MFKLLRNFFKKKKEEKICPEVRIVLTDVGFLRYEPNNPTPKPCVKLRKANKTSFKKGNTPWTKGKKKNGK